MNFFRFLNTGPDVMLNLTDHVEASRSCWSILIMLVLTDHAGAYWSCWILLIILVLTDHAGANWSFWSKLIMLKLTDHAECIWSCLSLLIDSTGEKVGNAIQTTFDTINEVFVAAVKVALGDRPKLKSFYHYLKYYHNLQKQKIHQVKVLSTFSSKGIWTSVTRFGNFLDFGQLFKDFGSLY